MHKIGICHYRQAASDFGDSFTAGNEFSTYSSEGSAYGSECFTSFRGSSTYSSEFSASFRGSSTYGSEGSTTFRESSTYGSEGLAESGTCKRTLLLGVLRDKSIPPEIFGGVKSVSIGFSFLFLKINNFEKTIILN